MKRTISIIFLLIFGTAVSSNLDEASIDSAYVLLRFDSIPKFTTQLSEDKQIVRLNYKGSYSINKIEKNNIIIEARKDGEYSTLEISFTKKIGFTTLELPYSKSVRVNFFEWEKLVLSEDKYHTALLALQAGIYESAYEELFKSLKMQNGNSASVLSILAVRDSLPNTAEKLLNIASKNKTDINENSAVKSHIFKLKSDNDSSAKYLKEFLTLKKIDSLTYPKIAYNPNSFLLRDSVVAFIDSLQNTFLTKDTSNKEIESKFKSIFADKDSTEALSEIDSNPLNSFLKDFLIYGIALVLVLVIYLYFRWRTKTLQSMKELESKQKSKKKAPPQKSKFDDELTKSKQAESPKAAPPPKGNSPINVYKNTEQKTETTPTKPATEKPKRSLADAIKEGSAGELSKIFERSKKTEAPDEKKSISPELQLAMQLAKEQKSIKSKNINSLTSEKLNVTQEDLAKVAKKLGIERGSIETKKMLENLEKDEESLKKLQSKFKKK